MLLKEKRSTTGADWEERQTTRQMEMETCSKALAILSSDDAHTLFTKTFNPSFMQTNIESAPDEARSRKCPIADQPGTCYRTDGRRWSGFSDGICAFQFVFDETSFVHL